MKIKRIIKYTSIIGLPSVLFLAPACVLASSVFEDTITTKNILSPTTQAASGSLVTEIASNNVPLTGWSWPDDKFPTHQGYRYYSPDKKDLVFTINGDTFDYNKAFPKFSKEKSGGWMGVDGDSLKYGTVTQSIKIQSQKYNPATRVIDAVKDILSGDMEFGETSKDNLRSLVNSASGGNSSHFDLNEQQPYMVYDIPFISYGQLQWTIYVYTGECVEKDKIIDWRNGPTKLFLSNNTDELPYDGVLNSTLAEERDPRHQYLIYDADYNHMHSYFKGHTTRISVFKDIGEYSGGTVNNTIMTTNGVKFNSVLPELVVDTSKLDFKKGPTAQDLSIKGILTASNAKSLPMGGVKPTVIATSSQKDGSITFNYKPERVFVDGVLQNYVGDGVNLVVPGFMKMRTLITSLPGYPNTVVVDRFLGLVKKDNVVLTSELGKYLDLSTVPVGASYDILEDYKIDYVKGTIEFNITASNGYYTDNTETKLTTPAYPITLQLTPRITKYTRIAENPDNLAVDQMYAKFFNPTTLEWNKTEFLKYHSVIAPVDNHKYYLVPGSYNIHTGDGTVNFEYYADKYYGRDGLEKVGSVSDTTSHLSDSYTLNPLASKVGVKSVDKPTHRVDKFIGLVADSSGNITDLDLLKQYVNMENIPSAATYAIDLKTVKYDPFNYDEFYNSVEFDLEISKYNEPSTVSGKTVTTPIAKTIPLRLKLDLVHTETKISARSIGDYDSTVRVDLLLPDIIDADGVVINRPLLEKYITIKSLPESSTLKVRNITLIHSTGLLRFDLIPNVSFGPDTEERNDFVYPIELQLAIRHEPTIITVNEKITNPERVDRFANTIQNINNFSDLMNYLAPKYLTVKGDFPLANDEMKYEITDLVYSDLGNISFNLIIGEIFNDIADVITNVKYPVSLNLAPRYVATNVDLIQAYPRGVSLDDHLNKINEYQNDQPQLKTYLSNFLVGMNTFPDTSIITYHTLESNEIDGTTMFYISATTYYDSQFDERIGYTSKTFSMQLVSQNNLPTLTTAIIWKPDVVINGDARDFFNIVSHDNIIDINLLSQYLDFQNIPLGADVSAYNNDPEFKSPMIIQLHVQVSQWWEDGVLSPGLTKSVSQPKLFSVEKNLHPIVQQEANAEFPWWWIVTGIVLAALIVIIAIYTKKHINGSIKHQSHRSRY